MSHTPNSSHPVNAYVAMALAVLPLPAMKALDVLNRGCGDGLCGFFSGLLILGALAAACIYFIVRSARRSERPALLRLLPLPIWAAALAWLMI